MLTTDHEACSTHCAYRDLTFDMSGGAKGAKRPLGRPLDGGVRSHSLGRPSRGLPQPMGPVPNSFSMCLEAPWARRKAAIGAVDA